MFSSAAVSLALVSLGTFIKTLQTHSSSTRYGGAPNEVRRATLTEGTALAVSSRPKAVHALNASLLGDLVIVVPLACV